MTLRTAVVVGLAGASLLTGCGGGSGAPAGGGTASRNTDARAALLTISRCMREHGYPSFPDPVVDSHGVWGFPDSAQNRGKAPAACDRIVRQAKARIGRTGGDRKQLSAADVARARSFARCMREHGVSDFPDPDAHGTFIMPARLRPTNGASVLRAPERACRQYMPKKGIRVAGGP
jgi:hypothetical protein